MKILLVDDEKIVDSSIGHFLRERGHEVDFIFSSRLALDAIASCDYDTVITDLRMPGADGIEIVHKVRATDPATAVIVITGHGDFEAAVAALRAGAADFLRKPIDLRELQLAIERTSHVSTLQHENENLRNVMGRDARETERRLGEEELVGTSGRMRTIIETIQLLSKRSWSTVLLTGESGTGKELVARRIHDASLGGKAPFISINCGGITPSLIESELFGHERGAFTGAMRTKRGLFELAHGGTLFLDEIGDMPIELQARLLRVLDDRAFRRVGGEKEIPVDFKLISATNRDLETMVASGTFRADLHFRLKVITIALPPLRERREDIPILLEYCLARLAREHARPQLALAPEVIEWLTGYAFPGNVRELRNILEQAVLLSRTDILGPADFPVMMTEQNSPVPGEAAAAAQDLNLESVEAALIRRALERVGGNTRDAASLLGIGYGALRYRMEKLRLS